MIFTVQTEKINGVVAREGSGKAFFGYYCLRLILRRNILIYMGTITSKQTRNSYNISVLSSSRLENYLESPIQIMRFFS